MRPRLHEIKRHRHTNPHLVLESGSEDAGPYFITTGCVGVVLVAFGTRTDGPSVSGTEQQRFTYDLVETVWAVLGLLEVTRRADVRKVVQAARRAAMKGIDDKAAFEREVLRRSANLLGMEAA